MITVGIIVITGYILLSLSCYLYTQSCQALVQKAKVKVIVVLSGDFMWDTVVRLKKGAKLSKIFPKTRIVVCGKYRGLFMKNYLQQQIQKKILLQNKSTTTFEDAKFLREILPQNSNLILVTSSPHQRRAYHTFQKIFNGNIYNAPTNDLFNYYSPLYFGGWIAVLINLFKDLKYNGKF